MISASHQILLGGIKSRILGLAGHVARVEKRIGLYRVLMGISEGKRPL